MSVFHELESLPLAYLVVLLWVVCSTTLARLLGWRLINRLPKSWQQLLGKPLGFSVTGDAIESHFLEPASFRNLRLYILVNILENFSAWLTGLALKQLPPHWLSCLQKRYPEKHWSGCPPNPDYSFI